MHRKTLKVQEDTVADTPVSIREVAALAGVSVGTVSNVLNRPDVVAEPTRRRVQDAIKKLGFIRNESARHLRAGRSRTIGLVVLVDSRSPSRGQCSVSVDDVLGGDLAVSHLLDAGHEHIAFVGGPLSIRQVADRRDGAVRALERAGRAVADMHVIETPALNVSAGQRAGAAIAEITADARPTAVFCANDLLALGVLQEMTNHRIRVPEGIAIVGYDDVDFASAAAVPLSSVRQPRHQLGRAAAQLLIEEALGSGAHRHRQVVFEPDLVVRKSSRGRPRRVRRPRRPTRVAGASPADAARTAVPPTEASAAQAAG